MIKPKTKLLFAVLLFFKVAAYAQPGGGRIWLNIFSNGKQLSFDSLHNSDNLSIRAYQCTAKGSTNSFPAGYSSIRVISPPPCSATDSTYTESMCFSASLILLDSDDPAMVRVVISGEKDSMVINISKLPAPGPLNSVFIDKIEYKPGVVGFLFPKKKACYVHKTEDSKENYPKNICNECWYVIFPNTSKKN